MIRSVLNFWAISLEASDLELISFSSCIANLNLIYSSSFSLLKRVFEASSNWLRRLYISSVNFSLALSIILLRNSLDLISQRIFKLEISCSWAILVLISCDAKNWWSELLNFLLLVLNFRKVVHYNDLDWFLLFFEIHCIIC